MKIALLIASEVRPLFSQIEAYLKEVGNEVVFIESDKELTQNLIKHMPDICYVDASLNEKVVSSCELLDCLGIEYVGSDSFVRALASDPRFVRHSLNNYSEFTGEYLTAWASRGVFISGQAASRCDEVSLEDLIKSRIAGGYPVCVQNVASSTMGSVNSAEEMKEVLEAAASTQTSLYVFPYIEGIALSVPVLGSGNNAYALCPIDLSLDAVVQGEALSHDEGSAEAIRSEIERAALEAYCSIGIADYGCVDVLWDGARVSIIRVNPSPAIVGETPFYKACERSGISLPGLFDALLSA